MDDEQGVKRVPRGFSHLPAELRREVWRLLAEDAQVINICATRRMLTLCGRVLLPAVRKSPVALYVCIESRDEALKQYNQSFESQLGYPVWFNDDLDTLYLENGAAMELFFNRTPMRGFAAQPYENMRFLAITPSSYFNGFRHIVIHPSFCAYMIYRFLPTLEEVVVVKPDEGDAARFCVDIINSLNDLVDRAKQIAEKETEEDEEKEEDNSLVNKLTKTTIAKENDAQITPELARPNIPAIFELTLGELEFHAKLRLSGRPSSRKLSVV